MPDAPPIVTVNNADDHPVHLDLPWGNVGRVEVKLDLDDARTLIHALTEAMAPGENHCPFSFAHTRHWCGYDGCRDS